jgi:DNA-directed RNA polymerase subunit beta'
VIEARRSEAETAAALAAPVDMKASDMDLGMSDAIDSRD